MSFFAVSAHVDRPDAALIGDRMERWVRVPTVSDWDQAMQEITRDTADGYAETLIGIHNAQNSRYFTFSGEAHRRDKNQRLIQPANPADRLYAADESALPDITSRHVAGEVTMVALGTRRADDHIFAIVSQDGFKHAEEFVETSILNPPRFNIAVNNCAVFGRAFFSAAGVALPMPPSIPAAVRRMSRPAHFSQIAEALSVNKPAFSGQILAGMPLILQRYQV
jgi:hypothetical protein